MKKKFLQLVCIESGNMIRFRKLSQDIGVAHTTIRDYFNILEDCMVAVRFDPVTRNPSRKRLSKASKYLIFDLGVRRLGAQEGRQLSQKTLAHLFEQWVGLELSRRCPPLAKIQFWRDHAGPEVDWVVVKDGHYIPVEVKWSATPSEKDARHLQPFLDDYGGQKGFVICQVARPQQLTPSVVALPWQMLGDVFDV